MTGVGSLHGVSDTVTSIAELGRRAKAASRVLATLPTATKDAALIRAADELHDDARISDATWATLTAELSTEQVMDVVFAVGQYNLVSMFLNTAGVQLDEGVPAAL